VEQETHRHVELLGVLQKLRPDHKTIADFRTRRHHVDSSVIHNAITMAVRRAGLTKSLSAHTVRHASAPHRRQRGTDRRTIQPQLGPNDRATAMLDTYILQPGGQGVPSPLDDLGV
jgi:site-specific recombinase XerD